MTCSFCGECPVDWIQQGDAVRKDGQIYSVPGFVRG